MTTSENSSVQATQIRIFRADKNEWNLYKQDVLVQTLLDSRISPRFYLRLEAVKKEILLEPLDSCEWLEDSSSDGVATITSPSCTIVILYDGTDKNRCNFFNYLCACIEHAKKSTTTYVPPPTTAPDRSSPSIQSASRQRRTAEKQWNQDEIRAAIDKLIRSIQEGSITDAENLAQQLARLTVSARFNLINSENNQEKKKLAAATPPLNPPLKLTLHIESHLNRPPIVGSIDVRPGTTLKFLKQEIENETGVRCTEQFWYANGRHLIPDDYKFGSSKSVSPATPRLLPRNQQPNPPADPVRTGDTLILYIGKSTPLC